MASVFLAVYQIAYPAKVLKPDVKLRITFFRNLVIMYSAK